MSLHAGARRPVIGITGRRFRASDLFVDDARLMDGLMIDGYFTAYAEKVIAAGGDPIHLSSALDQRTVDDLTDAVILSGGLDLDPRTYESEVTGLVGAFDTVQDTFDIAVVRQSLTSGRPVLGCCRGAQIINVACGGTLIEDLPTLGVQGHNVRQFPPSSTRHRVELIEGTIVNSIYGLATEVNSFHHQAVNSLGRDLRVSGRASDGTIEAVEHRDLPLVGVQWHPELHDGVEGIFAWLVQAATAWRQDRIPTSEGTRA
jgi:putative glutamine amidotransferase